MQKRKCKVKGKKIITILTNISNNDQVLCMCYYNTAKGTQQNFC